MRMTSITVAIVAVLGAGSLGAQQPDMHMKGSMKGTMKGPMTPSPAAQARIRQAMQAAPPEISAHATIVDWPEKDGMPMKELRPGTNGWTCMPSSPAAPDGPAGEDPMCVDKTFSALLDAWMTKADPRITSVGVGYMLRGDKGASNTDPFAMARTETNHWIVSPPHLMIAVPDASQLDAFPTDPHSGGPWVMWKGTKYAHLMVPTTAMPKATMGTTGVSGK